MPRRSASFGVEIRTAPRAAWQGKREKVRPARFVSAPSAEYDRAEILSLVSGIYLLEDAHMIKPIRLLVGSILFAPILLLAHAAQAQTASSKVAVTTVVTVLGPNYMAPPAIGKSDVVVHTGKQREDVTAWIP